MSGSDLVVNFVHKDLRLKDGFQISPVNQVEMSFKGVWIYKEEKHTHINSQIGQTMITQKINPPLL